MIFKDRKDAAIQLAHALEKYKGQNVLVLGIPRGGAETAWYIANHLGAEMSLLISRKLGHPHDPEYAIGAIAEDGSTWYNPDAVSGVSKEAIEAVKAEQQQEIQRRIQMLREGKPLPELRDRIVILADDGIATGATIFAAIAMCRKKGAAKVVVAAPGCARDKQMELEDLADDVVILETPSPFYAVSQLYESFFNLTDEEAMAFMKKK